MKLRLFLAAILCGLFMTGHAQNYKYDVLEGDITQTRIYTLSNGLKVYLSVNKEKPRIQANIAVRTGSRNDPAETTGLAHYLEHLMFKGTKKFGVSDPVAEAPYLDDIEARYEVYRTLTDPDARRKAYHEIDSVSQLAAKYFIPNEYDKLMSAIGSEGTNAYTSNDVTCYVENIPSNEIENWARVQADRFQNMVIRGFHTELEAVYEEKNIGMAQDNRKMWEALYAKMFPTHPYGTQTTIGTQEHLKNPSITNIKNYFKRYYVPNNVAICMAGDFDPDEVIRIIDKYFSSWKRSDNLSFPQYGPQRPITAPIDTTVIGKESEYLFMGWRFDGPQSHQSDTLSMISSILANGKCGLFEIDLEQQMKLTSAGAFTDDMAEYTPFIIYGYPKDNQTLEEVRSILLEEIDKLRRGEFDDDLIPSVVNNAKLNYFRAVQNNRNRASMMVDAFINRLEWQDVVQQVDRLSRITKQDVMDFANKHLHDNFVCVYKHIGTDSTQVKIEKPEITAIPTNRDMSSQFLNDIKNSYVRPIEPRFLDFEKDLTVSTTKKGLPLLYKHNDEDGLFTLTFMYDFGEESDVNLNYGPQYMDYIGTNKKSVSEIKQQFYKLACNYSITVNDFYTTVTLTGLSETMAPALALLEDFIQNAKADPESYQQLVSLLQKNREDAKKNQSTNFAVLRSYAQFGKYNSNLNQLSESQLRAADPQHFLDLIADLKNHEHTVLYYGPMSEKELDKVLTKYHKTAKKLKAAPIGKEYTEQLTPINEVYIAPYEAKNIYMVQYHNEGKPWNLEEAPIRTMLNEYFGGGMNTIVFQELRESRGLAYSAAASYSAPFRLNHPETYLTYIVSQNDKMMDCINTFNSILDTIPQSEGAFEIAKQSAIKSLQTARTTKFNVLNTYYWAKKRGFDFDINERVYNALPSVTLQDVVNFEKKNMANKTYKYIILGDEKELDMKALEKIGPIHRLTTEEIFGY
ncbi:MAG: insulinase family protein [Prevotella sp.]|nr:insulinase family protein [Prevotella sp.]